MLLISLLLVLYVNTCDGTQRQLINYITKLTSPSIRPVKDKSGPVKVTLGFTLHQIIDLNEQEQHVTAKIWLRMKWFNEYMKWKPSDWSNITDVRLSQSLLWTPDLFLEDDVGDNVAQGPYAYKTHVNVYASGDQSWWIPVKIQSACNIDVSEFPFDHQVCSFTFLSWSHNQRELDIIRETKGIINPAHFTNSSEWALQNVEIILHSKMYDCCPNPYVSLEFKITLLRHPFIHIYFLVIPCVIQMIMMLATFFLPLESGERIGVIITILLVFAVYLQVLSNSLPSASASTPLLSRFYIITMTESAVLMVVTFFIMNVHFKGSRADAEKMPEWLRKIFLCTNEKDKEDTDVKMAPHDEGTTSGATHVVDDMQLLSEIKIITRQIREGNERDEIQEEWHKLAQQLNRFFFFIFFLVFLISSVGILLPAYSSHSKSSHSQS